VSNVTDLSAHLAASRPAGAYEVTLDGNKLILPAVPKADDLAGMCGWLTAVWSLSPAHPVTHASKLGVSGPDGHVVVARAAGAPEIRFEPASKLNTSNRLTEALTWQTIPSDGPLHAFGPPHCRTIAYVVRMLCGAHETISADQETIGIIGTFLQDAEPVEGCTTYGTPAQRFEAAVALRPDVGPRGPWHYLLDENTGEFVIRVSDLADAARRHIGSSVARGWLDARILSLGWKRIRLDGHAHPGRQGRQGGEHARVTAYRGVLLAATEDPTAVTT
jgi:hypothetical protein